MLINILIVVQSLLVSLGVGASTLAVVNFFVAIWDGKIDPNERRMMGVVYIILRIAMMALLFVNLMLSVLWYTNGYDFNIFLAQVWLLLGLLFVNALLMTYCKMPSAFGPAIQASAWYSLGLISALRIVDVEISILILSLVYAFLCLLFVAIFNLIMMYCKHCQETKKVCIPPK